jgi:tetratricopeptide (TPR) repeat protein
LPIGEILIQAGLVSQGQLDEAVKHTGTRQRLIGKTLIARGWLKPEQLRAALQAQSLLRDGIVDSFKALKALGIACNFDKPFEEALQEITASSAAVQKRGSTCKLGELLIDAGIIEKEEIEAAHHKSLERGEPLGVVLVAEGLLTESYLDAALELQVRVRDGMFSREQAITALKQDPRRLLDMIAPNMKADEGLKLKTKAAIRLGELLMRAGIVSQSDVLQALELSLAHGHPIGEMLVARGFVSRALLDAALSLQQMITAAHLSIGEATACLVKVFDSNKAVSECLLELNFLKLQTPSEAVGGRVRPGRKPTQSQPDNRATVTELPALSFHKAEPGLESLIAEQSVASVQLKGVLEAKLEARIEAELEAKAELEAEIQNLANRTDESLATESLATEESNKTAELLPTEESFPSEEEYIATNFAYFQGDRPEFYESLRDAYSRLGRVMMKRKELIESEDMLKVAADISAAENILEKQPEDLMFLACLYLKQGKSWQSEKLLKRCLSILEASPNVSDRLVALCHHRLALVYCHLSLLFKAEKHFKKASELMGASDQGALNRLTQRRLAAILKDYAVLLNRMRRESEADKYYAQARKILSSSLLTG